MPHCWKDYLEWISERYGFGSEEWVAATTELHYMDRYFDDNAPRYIGRSCMLPEGHDGQHDWVSDDEISVTFPSQ